MEERFGVYLLNHEIFNVHGISMTRPLSDCQSKGIYMYVIDDVNNIECAIDV